MSLPKPPNASTLGESVCLALTPGASRVLLELDAHGWVLESTLPAICKSEQARVREHLAESLRSIHHNPSALRRLYRYVDNSGAIIAAFFADERHWHFRDDLNIAISLGPLYSSGHVDLAEKLRKKLGDNGVIQCIANMAYSLYKKEGQREALRDAFALVEAESYMRALVYDVAIEAFGPLGYLPEILAQARAAGSSAWLSTMLSLQRHGYLDVLQEELSAERIDVHAQGIFQRIDASLWIKKANDTALVDCWLKYWRDARLKPRRQALAGQGNRWFFDLAMLVSTLGGPEATEATLREVLHIGQWFA
jgi:hypothetical protein